MLVLFVAGEGGHLEQFRRLYSLLESKINSDRKILITDVPRKIDINIDCFFLGCLREKSGFHLKSLFSYIKKIFELYKFLSKENKISMISTGPGISLGCAVIVKIFGGRVIHIETWSRFYSKSITGKFMYYLSDKFYVQNIELLSLYPKAIYSGRL
ncbi:PssD/Cps14F family polysaccharide biosynthesis glycosyltransferase [Vibrio cholerae]|uniref:PssD/Cps14F family polysaccharide biosynthesis glycosyltransferase n=1 Tax=Vibrio cholerae TaxID=666 RepID=UPI000E0BE94C|nr:PssD/Cps14F family polysaccharide biosynthesis glycosyltransferase [Vibrio cholerae]EGR2460842.1 polysaccharide biosynthesis protein [Vibrio cholerae]EKO5179233.1 polysaccharide biosynthesis protein [Vibrio cholerae]ELF5326246.1 polysaccharide biosynthesis protein [Vibrio cholerae]MCD1227282.1 hypothetical protein [Vibrio cholerae]MCD1244781.1 hypothetical protein [Vibrio cholerae]